MINGIVSGIFSLIAKLGDLILLPIVTLISSFIPDFTNFYNSVVDFITQGFSYCGFIVRFLGIPKICIDLVYLIAVTSLSLIIGVRAYALIVKIYNKFKI